MYTPWLVHRLSSAFSSGNLLMRAATASVSKLNVGASWRMCRCSDVIAASVAGSSTVKGFWLLCPSMATFVRLLCTSVGMQV
jgi:hypothetical protein